IYRVHRDRTSLPDRPPQQCGLVDQGAADARRDGQDGAARLLLDGTDRAVPRQNLASTPLPPPPGAATANRGGRAGGTGGDCPAAVPRDPRSGAARQVRCPPRPPRARAEREPLGAGADDQRPVSWLGPLDEPRGLALP